jgi:diacylglycerol kinase
MVVIFSGILFGIDRNEWLFVILCIGTVFITEILNTAIENMVDMISPQPGEKAGIVKDISAGAVLVSAVISVIAGLIIFLPYVRETFEALFS